MSYYASWNIIKETLIQINNMRRIWVCRIGWRYYFSAKHVRLQGKYFEQRKEIGYVGMSLFFFFVLLCISCSY